MNTRRENLGETSACDCILSRLQWKLCFQPCQDPWCSNEDEARKEGPRFGGSLTANAFAGTKREVISPRIRSRCANQNIIRLPSWCRLGCLLSVVPFREKLASSPAHVVAWNVGRRWYRAVFHIQKSKSIVINVTPRVPGIRSGRHGYGG